MGRINVLGFDVANLIAAGEVVDRPSSVVKELLENSIDAGASVITVEIQRGGVAFIRISDNGCGMEPDELPVSILRHATSKISGAEDLSHIATLGFRGEALAAIASVSRLRIFSKPKECSMGAILTAEGGEVLDITETGCADGTTVVVEDLFFNVPARRKFLKKDATEAAAVSAVVERIALSKPDISVKYICDGEMRFVTSGDGKLLSAIYSVFGRNISSRTIEVSREADGISVSGYVSEPDLFKSNRNMENFFVNGRYVKSKTAIAAVEQAYKTRIPQDKFPFCVLNININPAAVDVNVHPAKLEIKFTNERIIFDAVYYAVLNALESEVVRPELSLSQRSLSQKGASQRSVSQTGISQAALGGRESAIYGNISSTEDTRTSQPGNGHKDEKDIYGSKTTSYGTSDAPVMKKKNDSSFWIDGNEAKRLLGAFVPADVKTKAAPQAKIQFEEKQSIEVHHTVSETEKLIDGSELATQKQSGGRDGASTEPKMKFAEDTRSFTEETKNIPSASENPDDVIAPPDYIILGEAYNCYVIVQLEDRLLFVDKHAAHERIIFDELCRKMRKSGHDGQLLLTPLTVDLLEIEADAVSEYGDRIRAAGFDFTTSRDGNKITASITQIPEMLDSTESLELFSTLANRLTDVGAGADAAAEEFFEARLFQSSCKAAIKGGRVYDTAHIKWICDRLLVKSENGGSVIRTCPHGRPVAFEVKKSSIDRQFARIN
ncbi:MAG: DNA mismatch repair endonuclease MutL [Clostridiales bacterium]|nr:DNA mismatch repair endonuclease MutL [Clostridiales bacterium]